LHAPRWRRRLAPCQRRTSCGRPAPLSPAGGSRATEGPAPRVWRHRGLGASSIARVAAIELPWAARGWPKWPLGAASEAWSGPRRPPFLLLSLPFPVPPLHPLPWPGCPAPPAELRGGASRGVGGLLGPLPPFWALPPSRLGRFGQPEPSPEDSSCERKGMPLGAWLPGFLPPARSPSNPIQSNPLESTELRCIVLWCAVLCSALLC